MFLCFVCIFFVFYRQNSCYDSRRPSYVQVQEIQHDVGQLVQDMTKVPLDIAAINAFAHSQSLTEINFIIKGSSGKMELTEIGVIAVKKFKKKEVKKDDTQ